MKKYLTLIYLPTCCRVSHVWLSLLTRWRRRRKFLLKLISLSACLPLWECTKKFYHRQGRVCVYVYDFLMYIHTYGNIIRSQMTDEVGFFTLCRRLQIIYNVNLALRGVAEGIEHLSVILQKNKLFYSNLRSILNLMIFFSKSPS